VIEGPRYIYSELVPRVRAEPSLAYVPPRLIRATTRFAELAEVFAEMAARVTTAPTVTARLADMDQPRPPLTLDLTDVLPWHESSELRLLVSEILHHIRTAADHLVYNVAWLDSGKEQRRTQFPIVKKASDFNDIADRMLVGVSADHRAWIEAAQPYNGVTWTEALAYLSNNDKHNYLLEVVPTLRYRVDLHAGVQSGFDAETVSLPVDNLEAHLRIIRRDGGPYESLSTTLGGIVNGLADLANLFLREAGISELRVEVNAP